MVVREALKLSQQPAASVPTQHIEITKVPVQEEPASALAESVDNTVESNGERLGTPSATPDVGTPLRQEQTAQELRGALGHPEDDREDETLYHVNDPQAPILCLSVSKLTLGNHKYMFRLSANR